MEENDAPKSCQIQCLPGLFEGYPETPPESLARRLRVAVRRRLNAHQVRVLKAKSSRLVDDVLTLLSAKRKVPVPDSDPISSTLQAGDLARVRSREEIRATLNRWGQLKGCTFLGPEMSPYCGTVQRVFKSVERFVDERDYRVKKTSGIILLEGVHCQGTSDYGRCDRSCFFFWREEWLEKVDPIQST